MSNSSKEVPQICNYYVDEAGDGTLFSTRGRVIIGEEGCSKYFLMGLLYVPNPDKLSSELKKLHTDLLSDPYFQNIPSMTSKSKKTTIAFHAKDDLPEVRREVFSILRKHEDLLFFAVVKNKFKELEYTNESQKADSTYRYQPNQLYDYLVRRLFTGRLHAAHEYKICFAKRGRSDRTKALQEALELARQKSKVKGNIASVGLMNITTLTPAKQHALQAVDYFLWALQRFYEKREDRYLNYVWPMYKLVIDIDDKHISGGGVHYSQKKPIVLASLPEQT